MPAGPGDDRALGVVYTPPALARAMAQVALQPLIEGRTAEQVLALRVCDPAIGEGVFLSAATDLLAEAVAAAWRRDGRGDHTLDDARRAVSSVCIAGVDVDAQALVTARRATGATAAAIQQGDALALDWRDAFPDVFAGGGFHVVLGNPPYIRQEWLARPQKAALRDFDCFDRVADLYVYFIELAHRLLRPRGRYCLITPNKWMTAAYGRPLRDFLAREASVEGIVDVSRLDVFGDAADAFPAIVWGTVKAPTAPPPLTAVRLERGAALPEQLAGLGVPHERERWTDEPWHIDDPHDRDLIDRLWARWPALDGVLSGRPQRGIVTGCNRAFVLDRAMHDELLAADPQAATFIRPFVKGRDIRRWLPVVPERWILLVDRGTELADLSPAIVAHLTRHRSALEPRPRDWIKAWHGRKPGTYRWWELQDPVGDLARSRAPRLFYQDIQSGPACSLDRDGLVPDTTVWTLPSSDLVLLAILNSPFYGWYARRRFPPALGGAVRPKLEYIRAMPIAQATVMQRAQIEQLVVERLEHEPLVRHGDVHAVRRVRDLDAALSEWVLALYELDRDDRKRVAAG